MKKAPPTQTTGPLHFEDLEPHRFEDLVRRLIYDFRDWEQLEATGRLGSDDGFDVRGFERGEFGTGEPQVEGEEVEAPADRVWLIQCKREQKITPKKLADYLDALPLSEIGPLTGIIFAAACDFSKLSRDTFRAKARSMGVEEAHLWGKGELEDMLYQPKYDDVLFTFFGISNRIRAKSLTSDIRRRLAAKRKAIRLLEFGVDVLIRDVTAETYPYVDDSKLSDRRWTIFRYEGCYHDGLHFLSRRCFAYVDDAGGWDYAEAMNDALPHEHPWRTSAEVAIYEARQNARSKAFEVWEGLSQSNRAWYEERRIVPYELVIDIDEQGDEFFDGKHLYVVPANATDGPFRDYVKLTLQPIGQVAGNADPDPDRRIKKFDRSPSNEDG